MDKTELKHQILNLVEQYCALQYPEKPLQAGNSVVPPSGKVIGVPELKNMVEALLDGWLTTGHFNEALEKRFAEFVGVPYALTTTSGSSANLLAFTALTSHNLGARALKPSNEVITVAAGFPTTVTPMLQNGMVPVFVDVNIPTYNIDPKKIEAAVTERTRAIMLATHWVIRLIWMPTWQLRRNTSSGSSRIAAGRSVRVTKASKSAHSVTSPLAVSIPHTTSLLAKEA
uniref:DegT/DnrJ/EryC1/StrS family aminotransferase n=1 Tax=Flavobacterium sp. TaxID=239 RepID=UPI004047DD30